MAVTGGPGGYGINIPFNIDLSGAMKELRAYQAAVDAFHERRRGGPDPSTVPTWGGASAATARASSASWSQNPKVANIKQAQQQALLAGMQVFRVTKRWPSGLQQGIFTPFKMPKPPKANASPGAQPQSMLNRSVGGMNAAIGGWRQLQQGQIPTKLGQVPGLGFLKGVSKIFGKNAAAIPGYTDFTMNRTSNTSYLGSVAGGLFHNIERFAAIQTASKAAGVGMGAAGVVAAAAAVYKGLELAARTGATVTAWAMKSGEAAMRHPAGRAFNDAVSAFDYVNNIGASVNNSLKMTADFDDTVASVTGKLPDTQKYLPRFFRIAQANLQFEAMVKRNLAMTRAGAMGNSDVSDQVAHTLFNAAAQR